MAFIPSPFKPTNRKYSLITGFANRYTLKKFCLRIYRKNLKTLGLEADIGSCLASRPIFGFDTVSSIVEIEKYGAKIELNIQIMVLLKLQNAIWPPCDALAAFSLSGRWKPVAHDPYVFLDILEISLCCRFAHLDNLTI